jgi:hypothetical protein
MLGAKIPMLKRKQCHSRSFSETLEPRVLMAAQVFTVIPSESTLAISLSIPGSSIDFIPQGSNPWGGDSLTTEYTGAVSADIAPGTIDISPSTQLTAIVNGSWIPNSESNDLPEIADYGVIGSNSFSDFYVAARNMGFQLQMPTETVQPNGTFDASQMSVTSTSGMVYDDLGDPPVDLTGMESGDAATSGAMYTVASGVGTLSIPIATSDVYYDSALSVYVDINFSGTIFATTSPPQANNDSASTAGNTAVTVPVLSNDTDAVGAINPASVTVGSAPADGSTTVNSATGQITYTPKAGFYGSDSFTYSFGDSVGLTSNLATVVIDVNPNGVTSTPFTTYSISGTPSSFSLTSGSLTIGTDLSTAFPNYSLNIGSGSKVTLTASQHMGGLQITGSGTLDLTNTHVIVAYSGGPDPKAALLTALRTGSNGGTWSGSGITSSTAAANSKHYGVGFSDGADGVDPSLKSGQIELAYALDGDITLQGSVNGTDFGLLAAHFGKTTTAGWEQGDFTYSGTVSGTQFSLLAGNFGKVATGTAVTETSIDSQKTPGPSSSDSLLDQKNAEATASIKRKRESR